LARGAGNGTGPGKGASIRVVGEEGGLSTDPGMVVPCRRMVSLSLSLSLSLSVSLTHSLTHALALLVCVGGNVEDGSGAVAPKKMERKEDGWNGA